MLVNGSAGAGVAIKGGVAVAAGGVQRVDLLLLVEQRGEDPELGRRVGHGGAEQRALRR